MSQISSPTLAQSIGQWLFRHRSYVPVPLGTFVTLSTWHFAISPTPLDSWNVLLRVWPISLFILAEAIRLHVVGRAPTQTSGRGRKFEAKTLVTVGPYRHTRNPLYIGNLLFWIGAASFSLNIWVLLVTILVMAVQYHLIVLAEERYLLGKYGQRYIDYCRATPRYVSLRRQESKIAAAPFDWKTGIIRDHDTIFLSILASWVLIGISLGILPGLLGPAIAAVWYSIIAIAFVVWLIAKVLKHRTAALARQQARRDTMYMTLVTSTPSFECRIQQTFRHIPDKAIT